MVYSDRRLMMPTAAESEGYIADIINRSNFPLDPRLTEAVM